MTRAVAFAAPVDEGIKDVAAARPLRLLRAGLSTSDWLAVYAWIVVTIRYSIPKLSFNTLTTGAREFVVQEALETI